MKKLIFILIVCSAWILAGCPGSTYKSELKKIQENKMDFPDLRKEYYNGLKFKISRLFSNDYATDYVIQDNALTKVIYSMDLHFSVEMFSPDEAELLAFGFEEDVDHIDAVHDYYIGRRVKSLHEPEVSIKKEVPKSVGYKGYTQVIHGGIYSTDYASSYFTSTLEIDGDYYVFQLIGKRENMGYLYDDFIDIISSIEQ